MVPWTTTDDSGLSPGGFSLRLHHQLEEEKQQPGQQGHCQTNGTSTLQNICCCTSPWSRVGTPSDWQGVLWTSPEVSSIQDFLNDSFLHRKSKTMSLNFISALLSPPRSSYFVTWHGRSNLLLWLAWAEVTTGISLTASRFCHGRVEKDWENQVLHFCMKILFMKPNVQLVSDLY